MLNLCVFYSDGAYELAISYLTSMEKATTVKDEKVLCQNIHSHLAKQSSRHVEKFDECYAKLKHSVSIISADIL